MLLLILTSGHQFLGAVTDVPLFKDKSCHPGLYTNDHLLCRSVPTGMLRIYIPMQKLRCNTVTVHSLQVIRTAARVSCNKADGEASRPTRNSSTVLSALMQPLERS